MAFLCRKQIEMPDSWTDALSDPEPREKVKFPASVAMEVAREIWPVLIPRCVPEASRLQSASLFKVCGSLRRRKAQVGDVEFVFAPRIVVTRAVQTDLLGAVLSEAVMTAATWPVLDDLVSRGVLAKRLKSNGALTGWGTWNRFAVHVASGLPLDFFACRPEAFWNTVVSRTGGTKSNMRICAAAIAKGWHWEPSPEAAGFQRRRGLAGAEQHAIGSEREVFEFVGMDYLEPWERE